MDFEYKARAKNFLYQVLNITGINLFKMHLFAMPWVLQTYVSFFLMILFQKHRVVNHLVLAEISDLLSIGMVKTKTNNENIILKIIMISRQG